MTATETLERIIQLTSANLELLSMINESFYTKKEYLTTMVDDTRYTIPSFISLENKVNHLQAAFNNLVHAPMTGEAYMNFDGNSRVIQMRGFQQAPPAVDLSNQDADELKYFYVEDSNLFKDMLSPKPYIKLDLSEIEDDVTQVVVKKIILYNQSIITALDPSRTITVSSLDYPSMNAILTSGNQYKKGLDYAEYDTVYDLPIRKLICSGEYIVSAVLEDNIDDALNNIITLQFDESTPTECKLFDGVTTRQLTEGDILTNFDGSSRMQIIEVQQAPRIVTVKVLSGEYINILPNVGSSVDEDKISDYSRLRFFQPVNFDADKYLKVPLEEDQYVFVSVAPLNSRMNVQAPWGEGLIVNVDSLTLRDVTDANGNSISFRDYYQSNVKNIGDTINELASILPAPLTNLSPVAFGTLINSKPYMTTEKGIIDTLKVVQINKHLNEAENIKTIRNLYSQKQQYKIDLEECQNKISTLTGELAEISFDDMTGSRTMISAQIDDLKTRQNELIKSINTAIDAISLAANDSEVPIEGSKFRIRGYVNIDRFLNKNLLNGYEGFIRAIRVRYRYKNPGVAELANVTTFGGGDSPDYLFTEWCEYKSPTRHKTAAYGNGSYIVGFDDPKQTENDIKFNQIDIPITQGEQVDLQVKIVWDFGYPFINIESDWSDVVTVKFPQELVTDVEVTTIIKENNSDIETYRFENILDNHGITRHSDDYIDDQNIRYFHKPESISSGFYTEERRIIPLADKLKDLNNQIASLQDAIAGTYASSLKVALVVNNTEYILSPDIKNVVNLPAYNSVNISADYQNVGTSVVKQSDVAAATSFGSLNIKNVSNNTLRLYAMSPGARDVHMVKTRKFNRMMNTYFDYAEPLAKYNSDSMATNVANNASQIAYVAAMNAMGKGSDLTWSTTHGGTDVVTVVPDITTTVDIAGFSSHADVVTGGGGGTTGPTGPTPGEPTTADTFPYECKYLFFYDDIPSNVNSNDSFADSYETTTGTAHLDIRQKNSTTSHLIVCGPNPYGNVGGDGYLDAYTQGPIDSDIAANQNVVRITNVRFLNRQYDIETNSNADWAFKMDIYKTNPRDNSGAAIQRVTYTASTANQIGDLVEPITLPYQGSFYIELALQIAAGKNAQNVQNIELDVTYETGDNKQKSTRMYINISGQDEDMPDNGNGGNSNDPNLAVNLRLSRKSTTGTTSTINLDSEENSINLILSPKSNNNIVIDPAKIPEHIKSNMNNTDNRLACMKLDYLISGADSDKFDITFKDTYGETNGYFWVLYNESDDTYTVDDTIPVKVTVSKKADAILENAGQLNICFTATPIVLNNQYDGYVIPMYDKSGYFAHNIVNVDTYDLIAKYSKNYTDPGVSGGGSSTPWINSTQIYDYTEAKMVYILNPIVLNSDKKKDNNLGTSSYVRTDPNLPDILNYQLCNQYVTFRIKEPFAGENLGDTTLQNMSSDSNVITDMKGVGNKNVQEELVKYISANNHIFDDSFVYATPAVSSVGDICIASDSTHAYVELGPGESLSLPIFIGYFIDESDPVKSYSLGFDVRNSLYNDPIFYQVTFQARYNQTFADMLQSQKASVRTATNYNPVIRS